MPTKVCLTLMAIYSKAGATLQAAQLLEQFLAQAHPTHKPFLPCLLLTMKGTPLLELSTLWLPRTAPMVKLSSICWQDNSMPSS